jgi:hypothetical protein
MQSELYVKAQTEIRDNTRRRLRDASGRRWTEPEIYGALNDCLMVWHDRVIIPHVYNLTDGWVQGTARYTLPPYIRGLIDPQQKRYTSDYLYVNYTNTTEDMWVDVNHFEIMPDGAGGHTVQFPDYLDNGDGRIIWWAHNGPVPLILPTVTTTIDADDTTLVVTTTESLPEAGYIKIGYEWIHYAGRAPGASSVTLSNLLRGLFSTTAEAHSNGADVAWGVGADSMELYQQMQHYMSAELHGLFLVDAAESERAHHERMRLHYLDLSDRFWRTYQPARAPKLRFDRRTIGDIGHNARSY